MASPRHVPPRWKDWSTRVLVEPRGSLAGPDSRLSTLAQVRVQVLARSTPDSKWAARARVARPCRPVRDCGTEGAATGPAAGSRAARSGGRSTASSAETSGKQVSGYFCIFVRTDWFVPWLFFSPSSRRIRDLGRFLIGF